MEFSLRALAGSPSAGELAQPIAEQRRKLPAPVFDAAAGVLCDAFDVARRSHLSVALRLLPAKLGHRRHSQQKEMARQHQAMQRTGSY